MSNLLLARLLTPEDFGIVGVAYIFWSLFTLFTQSSTSTFILYKGIADPKYTNTAYSLSLFFGLLTSGVLAAASPAIASFFNEPALTYLLLVYALNLLIASNYFPYSAVLMRRGQYHMLAIHTLVSSAIRLSFTVGAALLGFEYWSFAVGDAAFWLCESLLIVCRSDVRLALNVDPAKFKEVFRYCLSSVGTSAGFYANSNLDNFVVGKVLSKASLGYYNLAYQLSMALSAVINPVMNQVGTPIFAEIRDPNKQQDALLRACSTIAFIVTPLYALIFLTLDTSVIAALFGPSWGPVASVMPWLLIPSYFRVINTPLKASLSAQGYPKVNARVNLAIAPLAVVGFTVGAYNAGIVGVAISSTVILGGVWTVYWWVSGCKIFQWKTENFATILIPFTITVPLALLSYGLPFGLKQVIYISAYFGLTSVLYKKYFILYKDMLFKFFRKINLKRFQS